LEDWEKELHRELDALPELEAPSSLIPGVMERINAPVPAAWYRESWWQWPLAVRAASIVAVLAMLGVLGWLSGFFGNWGLGQHVFQAYAGLKEMLLVAVETGETVLGSGAVFWRKYGQIMLGAAAFLMLSTYLICVAAGTALYQLTWRRSYERTV
jgi:hypothetical protein